MGRCVLYLNNSTQKVSFAVILKLRYAAGGVRKPCFFGLYGSVYLYVKENLINHYIIKVMLVTVYKIFFLDLKYGNYAKGNGQEII